MSEPASFQAVIDLWPTREACAAEIGTNAPRVAKWFQRNNIPAEWWKAVLESPTGRGAGLTAEIFTTFAARVTVSDDELAEARP